MSLDATEESNHLQNHYAYVFGRWDVLQTLVETSHSLILLIVCGHYSTGKAIISRSESKSNVGQTMLSFSSTY